ncbi:MAG: [FeFe] hydrogenase H-cluster radical SAM maturase HydE [Verrucomicrobiota bacterium]|nr:[FeFe] hydrogenase H-cluster radical SAM maturase HydE [Verrucomicrobiota bacterium]
MKPPAYSRSDLVDLLSAQGEEMEALYRQADDVRRQSCGDGVPIRAILEFSNRCANDCLYCGIRASNSRPIRYRMTPGEILAVAHSLATVPAIGTLVLQSGESPGDSDEEITAWVRQVKTELPHLALTLSVGNRPREVYAAWRAAGMDRYLLRFETSDPALFAHLHPNGTLQDRLQCLRELKAAGVQTGSGFMVGLPGETMETLVDNILLCQSLDLDMIGFGPFIPHPDTPLAGRANIHAAHPDLFFKVLAVLRLMNPDAHIPATTAFDVLFPTGRFLALQRGANVFMPNATPLAYRTHYQLYPGKPGVDRGMEAVLREMEQKLQSVGRFLAQGPGHSLRSERRDEG